MFWTGPICVRILVKIEGLAHLFRCHAGSRRRWRRRRAGSIRYMWRRRGKRENCLLLGGVLPALQLRLQGGQHAAQGGQPQPALAVLAAQAQARLPARQQVVRAEETLPRSIARLHPWSVFGG